MSKNKPFSTPAEEFSNEGYVSRIPFSDNTPTVTTSVMSGGCAETPSDGSTIDFRKPWEKDHLLADYHKPRYRPVF